MDDRTEDAPQRPASPGPVRLRVLREPNRNRGRWLINGRRHVIYVQRKLDPDAQRAAAIALVRKLETKKE